MRDPSRCAIVACAVMCCALTMIAPAYGVIIGTGDGTANTTQGAMPAGWDNVGTVDNASAVYLGSGWVITAKHVGSVGAGVQVTFDSAGPFTSDGNVVRLTTPGQSSPADLQMFHLASAPSLPTLTIATASPTDDTFIYMAGYGRNRVEDPTYYQVTSDGQTPPTFTWTPVSNPNDANYGGFAYAFGSTKRWGTNNTTAASVDGQPASLTSVVDTGEGPTQVFFATFYDDLADYRTPGGDTDYEAQLANGDSGGGVFDVSNHLIGLINFKGPYAGQPDNTAVFGNVSAMADLSAYRDEILATMATPIPEPTTLALLAVGAGGLLLSRKRHGPGA